MCTDLIMRIKGDGTITKLRYFVDAVCFLWYEVQGKRYFPITSKVEKSSAVAISETDVLSHQILFVFMLLR